MSLGSAEAEVVANEAAEKAADEAVILGISKVVAAAAGDGEGDHVQSVIHI